MSHTLHEKNFQFVVTLRVTSQLTLESVTAETVRTQIERNLTHNDTITDVKVVKVEEAPGVLSRLIERLAVLQNVLDQIKEEIAK